MSDYVNNDNSLNATLVGFDDFDWDSIALPEEQGVDAQSTVPGSSNQGIDNSFSLPPSNGHDMVGLQFPEPYGQQALVQQPAMNACNNLNYGMLNDFSSNGFGNFNPPPFGLIQTSGQPGIPGYPMDSIGQDLQLAAPFQDPNSFGWPNVQEQSLHGQLMQPSAMVQPGIGLLQRPSLMDDLPLTEACHWPRLDVPDNATAFANCANVMPESGSLQPQSYSAPGVYPCGEAGCTRTFTLHKNLEKHVRSHPPEFFSCDHEDCNAIFKRKAELKRHQVNHRDTKLFPCLVVGCQRAGTKGFQRLDKLIAHLLAGHDDETIVTCPGLNGSICEAGPNGAPIELTRDLISVHVRMYADLWRSGPGTLAFSIHGMNNHRTCPLPRCPKRFFLDKYQATLDDLQLHLRDKHERLGREAYAGLLRSRGYDAITTDIVCPVCQNAFAYPGHELFYRHLLSAHWPILDVSDPSLGLDFHFHPTNLGPISIFQRVFFPKDCQAPAELHKHRRTILSLWPAFMDFPVWEDLRGKF